MKWLEKVVWLMALLWTAAALVPASFWYDGDDMRIDDVRAGRPVELFYSGGPLRSFVGSYAVIMRDIEAREIVGEDRSARFTYRTNGQRPVPLTLAWWAPGNARLQSLPPGRYQMETCWTVHDAFWGLVPPKTICSKSNIFQILEPGPVVFRLPADLRSE